MFLWVVKPLKLIEMEGVPRGMTLEQAQNERRDRQIDALTQKMDLLKKLKMALCFHIERMMNQFFMEILVMRVNLYLDQGVNKEKIETSKLNFLILMVVWIRTCTLIGYKELKEFLCIKNMMIEENSR